MSVVEDKSLFELLERLGPRLIRTKFGNVGTTGHQVLLLFKLYLISIFSH